MKYPTATDTSSTNNDKDNNNDNDDDDDDDNDEHECREGSVPSSSSSSSLFVLPKVVHPAAKAFFDALDQHQHQYQYHTGTTSKSRTRTKRMMSPSLQRKIQSVGWRNRYSQNEYYPISISSSSSSIIQTDREAENEQQPISSPLVVDFSVRQIQRGEINGTYGTGATVWPAAIVLVKYLEYTCTTTTTSQTTQTTTGKAAVIDDLCMNDNDDDDDIVNVYGKHIIDLGCGTGVTSIAAALLGATSIICTDGIESVVELATTNVQQCFVEQGQVVVSATEIATIKINTSETKRETIAPLDTKTAATTVMATTDSNNDAIKASTNNNSSSSSSSSSIIDNNNDDNEFAATATATTEEEVVVTTSTTTTIINKCPIRTQKYWWSDDEETARTLVNSYYTSNSNNSTTIASNRNSTILKNNGLIILVADCVLPKLYPIEPLIQAIATCIRLYDDENNHTDNDTDNCSSNTSTSNNKSACAILSYEYRYYKQGYDPKKEFIRLATSHKYQLIVSTVPKHKLHPIYATDDIELWIVTANKKKKKK